MRRGVLDVHLVVPVAQRAALVDEARPRVGEHGVGARVEALGAALEQRGRVEVVGGRHLKYSPRAKLARSRG